MLLTSLGGLVVFILDKRSPGVVFALLTSASALLLVGSIVAGGRGIARLGGRAGVRVSFFNLQAWLCLIGFIVGGLSLTAAGTASDQQDLEAVRQRLSALEGEVSGLRSEVEDEQSQRAQLEQQIREVQKRVSNLEGVTTHETTDAQ